jgi:outer membrane protein
MKTFNLALVTLAAASCCGLAMAQKAGSFSASIGATQISPSVSSGNLSAPSLPGSQVGINSNSQVTGAVNYSVSDNITVHVPIGFGFKHDITGSGAIAGVGKLADTKALPITVIGQYRFMGANAAFRPYIGAGATYVKFYDTNGTGVLTAITNPGGPGTGVSFQSKLAPTIQIGGVFNLTEKWYLEASYSRTFVSTRGTLSTGQTIDVKLDPNAYSLQVGYKF